MLQVIDIQKTFDRFAAVSKANLDVQAGEIVAVIGPNGAGKSTLFKIISGNLKPDQGKIIFDGADITALAPHEICRRGLSLSYQIVNLFSRQTVFENVQISVLSRLRKAFEFLTPSRHVAVRETEEILSSVGLLGVKNRICGTLSHGEQKVLEIAIALGSNPRLLILDEPTAGMSPEETASTINLLERLNDRGLTILFCEHDIELVFSLANRIMVMQQGISIVQGTPKEVRKNREVRKAYLGGSE